MLEDNQLLSFYINLTRRQREVVELASEGRTNHEIGAILCIAPCVVAGHLTNVYQQLCIVEGLDPKYRPNRYTIIRLFGGFFERHPELTSFTRQLKS
jgi:hypothetical protein